ncbi:MAG: ribonuclease, partial [Actinomycetota bacterium]|nr:ribonuclease [Actinomycetota bacterium]
MEAKLLPNYLAASYFPTELLAHVGATPVGSRADTGQYVTKSKSLRTQTRRLVFTVSDGGLQELQRLITDGGRNRTEDQALAQIRKFDEISLPREADVLRIPGGAPESSSGPRVWEAVLHPLTSTLGEPVPLDEDTLERWFALITDAGGKIYREYVRRVGGLTFAPTSLPPERVPALARFNPLRVIRPMPTIRPRPRFGTRSGNRLRPHQRRSEADRMVNRSDGRTSDQLREVRITRNWLDHAEGSALVEFGRT